MPEKYRILTVDRDLFDIADMVLDDPALIGGKTCRQLYGWWRENADRNGGVARWDDFDIVDHSNIIAHFYLLKVLDRGARFQFTLHGEFPRQLFRDTCWSKQFLAPDDPQPIKERLYYHYRQIMETHQPKRCYGQIRTAGVLTAEFESVDLPLADEKGEIVRFIGVLDFL